MFAAPKSKDIFLPLYVFKQCSNFCISKYLNTTLSKFFQSLNIWLIFLAIDMLMNAFCLERHMHKFTTIAKISIYLFTCLFIYTSSKKANSTNSIVGSWHTPYKYLLNAYILHCPSKAERLNHPHPNLLFKKNLLCEKVEMKSDF